MNATSGVAMTTAPSTGSPQELSLTVQTINCIACTPAFNRSLRKINGVLEIKELPITNKIIVVFDATHLDERSLEKKIGRISEKAGFGGKLMFHNRMPSSPVKRSGSRGKKAVMVLCDEAEPR
jgi:cation transport ATPase